MTAVDADAAVAIVGCGPVGAMLANLLGLQGIRTAVLDRGAGIHALPRAVHFDDEVMRLFQTVGLADAMAALVHVSPGMRFVDDEGRLLLDWSRPLEVGPQGWHASYRFHQPELEQVLRRGLARFSGVSVQLRAEVFALHPGPDGVLVRFEDLATGQLRALRARYVVGCDGARSLTRRLMGAPMEDLGFHEPWLVVDTVLRRPRPDLGDHSVQHCSRHRPATYVRGTGDRRRWEIAVLPGEDGGDLARPARVYELLRPWVGPEDVEVERSALYTFHSALATQWRSGRLLIAGDAAHLTPPFLGQGMCAGMRDAGNLAWKLGRVLAGRDADGLLDTYGTERSPHVREYIELAVRLGGLINTRAMRAMVPDATLDGGAPVTMGTLGPRLGPGIAAGWDGPAGRIAPQPTRDDGTRLDDLVGYRFALVVQPGVLAWMSPALPALLAANDVALVVAGTVQERSWLHSTGAVALLLRPDRYVMGAARTSGELQALANAVTTPERQPAARPTTAVGP